MTKSSGNNPRIDVHADQVFTNTFSVEENVSTEPALHISQEAFPLCEADFLRIKKGYLVTSTSASAILLTSIGLGLSVTTKFLQSKFGGSAPNLETWEWLAPLLGFILAVLLFGAGLLLPNERKQVMRDIENHFHERPRRRHLMERKK